MRPMAGWLLVLLAAFPLGAGLRIQNAGSQTRISLTLENLQRQTVAHAGHTFLRFSVEGLGVTSTPGDPRVPVLRRLFLAASPEEVQVSVHVRRRRVVDLGATPLEPVQPPVPKVPGAKVPFTWNQERYAQDAPYPGFLWRVKPAGTLRGQPLVLLEVYPVQYRPAQNQIELLELDLTVTVPPPTIRHPEKLSAPFLGALKRLAVNSATLDRVPPAPIGYLILVPDAYQSTLAPYAGWLVARGYHVTVAPLSEVGTSATEIRQYIQNAYNTWSVPPSFVLLVGDVDAIPNFTGQGTGNPDTDLNYGLMDDADYFPDVYVGRWSVSSADELAQVVNKALSYQQTAWSAGRAWAQRAYFMASDDASYHQVAEGTHLYAMGVVRAHGMVADSLFEYYGTGTPVATALNDGRALAVYSGHGYEQGWAGPSFGISDVYNLTNTDRYPLVESFACLTGSYAAYDTCFMEAWLRAPDRGAVAALGSSVTSYWDEDDVLERRMFDAQFDSNIVWVMGFVNTAKYALYLHYGNTGTVRRYFEMYNLFGDPALDVFTQAPETLYVDHADHLPLGTQNLTVTVTDPSGSVPDALVGIRNAADSLVASGYTDASGQVTLSVTVAANDTLFVTVTAHNHAPSYTQVLPQAEGPYVSLHSWTLNDGNGDGHPNPAESATLTVCVKNVGTQTAYGVQGILRAPSGVTLTDSQETFGTLAPGDSVIVPDAYGLEFSQDLADGQSLGFTLVFTYTLGDSTVSSFSMTVYAPKLVLGQVTVDDSSGNSTVDPGEPTTVYPAAHNVGHLGLEGVTGLLRTSDPYIQLVDSVAEYGSVDAGAEVAGSGFVFRADPSTPLHHAARFAVVWSSGFYTFADTFEVVIGVGGDFLVWDPDPNHSSGPVIYSILKDSLGYTGDYTTSLSDYADDLPYYRTLFVCVGIYSDNYRIQAGSSEAQWIEDYLAQGGNVYLEGGDVWYYDPTVGGHDFGPSFGIHALADGSGDLATVIGQNGTFTEGMSFAYGGENSWIDHLEPGTTTAFLIFANSSPSYGCGVANDAGTYRTVGLSFELGGLEDGASRKTLLLQGIMDFFLGSSVSPPRMVLTPESFDETVVAGDSLVRTLWIQNQGERSLAFSLSYSASKTRAQQRLAFVPKTQAQGKGAPEAHGFPPTKGSGGPDGFGYEWRDSNASGGPSFDWIEISSTGAPLALGDDDSAVVDLPWAFPFYGSSYTSVTVSSNGYLTFGSDGTDFSNDPIPSTTLPNAFIAPFWDDLNPSTDGEVYALYDSTADRFVVEWSGVPHYGSTAPYTFEVILYPDGRILFQYLDMQGDLTSATVGIENPEGTDGLPVVYNAAYVENQLAVEIAVPARWIRFSPTSGTVAPGAQAEIHLVFDATELDTGTYADTLYVHSNDPDRPVTPVPVHLAVAAWLYGDLDQDGRLTSLDLALLADYLYHGGEAPDPLDLGDVNRDGTVDDQDLVALSHRVMGSAKHPAVRPQRTLPERR